MRFQLPMLLVLPLSFFEVSMFYIITYYVYTYTLLHIFMIYFTVRLEKLTFLFDKISKSSELCSPRSV